MLRNRLPRSRTNHHANMIVLLFSLQGDCDPGYFVQSSSQTCKKCPDASQVSEDLTSCVCDNPDLIFNQETLSCVCPDGSFDMNGQCISCGVAGVKSDGSGCVCEIGYDIYQRRCCDSGEIYVDWNCWVCPTGSEMQENTCDCKVADTNYNAQTNVCECPELGDGRVQYYYNGACVACPTGAEAGTSGALTSLKSNCGCTIQSMTFSHATGKCACASGQYFYDNQCKSCPREAVFVGTSSPYCVCELEHSDFILADNACRCLSPYYYANSVCRECPANSTVSADNAQCVCQGDGTFFDPVDQACKCPKTAFKTADLHCVTCPNEAKPDPGQTTCICPTNQKYIPDNNTCVCDDQSKLAEGSCIRCPADAAKDADGTSCICTDITNGEYDSTTNRCNCKGTNMYKINGICHECPDGAVSSPEFTECICTDPQKHFFDDDCQACPDHAVWNAATLECECVAPGTMSEAKCLCTTGMGWFYGQCVICPENSDVGGDGKCICGPSLEMTTYGCVPEQAEISQRSTVISMQLIALPGSPAKPKLCFYQEYLQAYTYVDRDLDFTLCPSDASVSFFLEARRLQNNLIQSTLYFSTGADVLGAFAMYQPAVEITEMRLALSIFAPSLLNVSLLCPVAVNLTLLRSNITYIFGNATTNTFFGLVRTVQNLYINLLDYEAEMATIATQPSISLLSGPVNTSTFLNDSRFNINITSSNRFQSIMAIDGNAEIANINFTGFVKFQMGGLLFFDLGAGKSGDVAVKNCHFNTSMMPYSKDSIISAGTLGFRTYLSNLAVTDCIISGIRYISWGAYYVLFSIKAHGSNSVTTSNLKICDGIYNGSISLYAGGLVPQLPKEQCQ